MPGRDVDQHGLALLEHVARLLVEALHLLGLELVGGRRHDVVHEPLIAGRHAIDCDLPRVGRPDDRLQRVRAALRAVVRELGARRLGRATTATATGNRTGRRRSGLARQGRRPHIEIVVVDVRFPTAIRGATRLRCVAGLTALLLFCANASSVSHGPSNGTTSLDESSAKYAGGASRAGPPRPPRPPRPPGVNPGPARVQVYVASTHCQRDGPATKSIVDSSSLKLKFVKGSCVAVYEPPIAELSEAASFAWSNAARFSSVLASTTMKS